MNNFECKKDQADKLHSAATTCGGNNKPITKKGETAKPLIMNVGCGLDWNEDALNVDIENTGIQDIILDISKPWDQINKFHKTERFGLIYLGECCFDMIEQVAYWLIYETSNRPLKILRCYSSQEVVIPEIFASRQSKSLARSNTRTRYERKFTEISG